MATKSKQGCERTKKQIRNIVNQWEERSRRCAEVGIQTEHKFGITVEFSETNCRDIADLWKAILNMMNRKIMEELRFSAYTPIISSIHSEKSGSGLHPAASNASGRGIEGAGFSGDWTDTDPNKNLGDPDEILKINMMVGTFNRYAQKIISLDDAGSWYPEMQRKMTPIPMIAVAEGNTCCDGKYTTDEYRGEVYCNTCGWVYGSGEDVWTDGDLVENQTITDAEKEEELEAEVEEQSKKDDWKVPYVEGVPWHEWKPNNEPPELYNITIKVIEGETIEYTDLITGETVVETSWAPAPPGATNVIELDTGVVDHQSRIDRYIWEANKEISERAIDCCKTKCPTCIRLHGKLHRLIAKSLERKGILLE